MLSLSFFDLMPESVAAVGSVSATSYFFFGVALFAALVTVLPEEPDTSWMFVDDGWDEQADAEAHPNLYRTSAGAAGMPNGGGPSGTGTGQAGSDSSGTGASSGGIVGLEGEGQLHTGGFGQQVNRRLRAKDEDDRTDK